MTEEEAKTKACCAGALRPTDAGSCIGSACMAWRWGGLAFGAQVLTVQMVFDPETKSTQTISEAPPKWGYCGLAGRP